MGQTANASPQTASHDGNKPRPRIDLERARQLMDQYGLDCLVASSPHNICFTTSARISVAENVIHRFHFAVFPRSGEPCFIVSEPERWIAQEQTWITDIRHYHSLLRPWSAGERTTELSPTIGATSTPLELLADVLKEKGVERGRVGIETAWMPVYYFQRLRGLLPDATLQSADEVLKLLHHVKTDEEIGLLRHANVSSAKALHFAFESSHVGDLEISVAAKVAYFMALAGMELRAWSFGSGPRRGGKGHPWATRKALEVGDLVHADPKGTYKGYHCDVVRMACVGEPTQAMKRMYGKILAIHLATVEACKPGVAAHDIFHVAEGLFEREGLKMHMSMVGYSLGADLGHDPHLGDVTLMHGNMSRLEPRMVLDVGIAYDAPEGRWHIEDAILVTDDSPELLSDYPRGGQYLYAII